MRWWRDPATAREGPECRQAERGLDSLAPASVNVLFVFVPARAERGAIKSDRNTLPASILVAFSPAKRYSLRRKMLYQ
jgi:hypothetical protein